MLPGNVLLSHASVHFSGITFSLYDEARVALRSRRIEKEQVAQSEGHSGMYQQETVLVFLTIHLLSISYTQPSRAGHNVHKGRSLN